jgi:hypothetical protein
MTNTEKAYCEKSIKSIPLKKKKTFEKYNEKRNTHRMQFYDRLVT